MEKKLWLRLSIYAVIIVMLCGLVFAIAQNDKKLLAGYDSSSVVTTAPPATEKPAQTEQQTAATTAPQQSSDSLSFDTVEQAEEYIADYARKKGYDFNDYPEKLIELTVKDKTAIPFVLDYPEEIKKPHSSTVDEVELNNGIPLFLQWDSRWGYHEFKNGVVALDGCGATCLSMAAMYLTGDTSLTPDSIADYAADNGYFVDGSGTSWDLFTSGVKHYGLKSKTVAKSESALKSALDGGSPVIASVSAGDFTKKGHYIVITGYDEKGFKVNDPFSLVNSQKQWSYERLNPQIKAMWKIYK